MDKRSIVLTLQLAFLLGVSQLKAQVYEPAFIISLYGDTIRCQIKHIRFITNKTEYMYKKSLDDRKDLYISSKDVLWIITPKDTFECLKMDKGMAKGEVYAFRVLVKGHLKLYAQDRFSKLPGEASAVFFLKKEGMPLKELNEVEHQKQLLNYTLDDPLSQEKIPSVSYNEQEMVEYIKAYNSWYASNRK